MKVTIFIISLVWLLCPTCWAEAPGQESVGDYISSATYDRESDTTTPMATSVVEPKLRTPDVNTGAKRGVRGAAHVLSVGSGSEETHQRLVAIDHSCHSVCAPGACVHRSGVFADLLYLRPSNVDVVFAVEQTDPDPNIANPTGQVGIASFDSSVGIRGGFSYAITDYSSIVASYTWYETDTSAQIAAGPGNVLDSRIFHPSSATSGSASVASLAVYDLRVQRADLDYRWLMAGDCFWAINLTGGIRYGNLDQQFRTQQTLAVATGLTTATIDIDFDGFGIGLGIDGELHSRSSGFLVYGKGAASFLQGEYKADFTQTNQIGGGVIANSLRDNRFVSILDIELGIAWQNESGRLRFSGGYMASGWLNTITTDTYVQGFRQGDLSDLSETMILSGFVGRIEYRF